MKQCPSLALIAAVLFCPPLAVPGGSGTQPDPKAFDYALDRMGTTFRIVLYAPDGARALGAAMAAFERVEELEQILSDYRADSEVSNLCRSGYLAPVAVSPELFTVLEQSLRISALSSGVFDVTIGPVVRLWRQARKAGVVPGAADLKRAREAVGYQNLVLDRAARTVQLKVPNMQLDFGAIGKGYAADEALAVLNARGIRIAMVDAGGDLRLGAPPPGKQGWKIAVSGSEMSAQGAHQYLVLHDVGVATSGDAFQFVEAAGRRYSHIVEPSTGMGLSQSATVTVVARDGITADALATAASVMSVSQAVRFIESIDGASAAIVSRGETGVNRAVSARFPKLQNDNSQPRTGRSLRKRQSS